ncbi:MAG TPA: hypothetical protein VIA06_25160, partial [Candidatus Dormibacteraeota bacterium]|nr:hypothetical protein [Candidatus Dormibacteraeota bacterium]
MDEGAIPLITARGDSHELGLQHGSAARDRIRAVYEMRMGRVTRHMTESDALRDATRYMDAVERYAPELVEEVRGIAEGSRLSFCQAFFLQVATELELAGARDGCSSVG